jgi:hypothetical protein
MEVDRGNSDDEDEDEDDDESDGGIVLMRSLGTVGLKAARVSSSEDERDKAAGECEELEDEAERRLF